MIPQFRAIPRDNISFPLVFGVSSSRIDLGYGGKRTCMNGEHPHAGNGRAADDFLHRKERQE